GNYEWKHLEECQEKNITAILGVGFDPGVVNSYAKLAQQQYFDRIDSIDILDVNAGSHGKYFATNFDPEINFREFTGQVWSWQNSQ
ncbi:saccharopine dehydrogenase, partial [Pseudomonas sp. SIMBA_059]